MSSSDVENLDRLEEEGSLPASHFRHQVQREANARVDAAKYHMKAFQPHNNHEGWRGDQHPPRADDEEVAKERGKAGQTSRNGELQHPEPWKSEGPSATTKS
jgi:hypothetical protein